MVEGQTIKESGTQRTDTQPVQFGSYGSVRVGSFRFSLVRSARLGSGLVEGTGGLLEALEFNPNSEAFESA